jgi:hypothetical protein
LNSGLAPEQTDLANRDRNQRLNPKDPSTMEKKDLMKKIVGLVGREKAIDLVMQAYNTEMLTTLLNRLEEAKPNMISKFDRRDQLQDALNRVAQVCDLAT